MTKPKSLAVIASEGELLELLVSKDNFKVVLNSPPPKEYVKQHPTASGVRYIPIDKIELMMDKVYQEWHVEIVDTKIMANAVAVTVRVHQRNPITQEWEFQDGVGATALQIDKGHKASDLQAIKSNAVMLGLPSAKSYAIKDAVEHNGKLFGRDLNRKDTVAFEASYATDENISLVEQKKEELRKKLEDENNPS